MASSSENVMTREGLIWRVVECVARMEGKDFTWSGSEVTVDRSYILDLVAEAIAVVNGKQPSS